MDSKEIRELIELISRSNVQSFEFERQGLRLKLVKQKAPRLPAALPSSGPPAVVSATASPPAALPAAGSATGEAAASDLHALTSPIVGTFYRAAGPGSPNFVEVGSRVTQGQTLCIVEAMKVMNEIESEIDAEVVEILVANGQPVEYGELMFRLRPL